MFCILLQRQLSKAKDELEAEKRELVRTLERRSQEVESQSGMSATVLYIK